MPPRICCLLLLACSWPLASGPARTRESDRSTQCVIVLTDNWESTAGVLQSFQRGSPAGRWRRQGSEVPVAVGRKGLGAGRGLARIDFAGAPAKKEGDNKAPAGVFRLSSAFGYAPARSAGWIKLPYLALSRNIEGIDDPNSRYYNTLVDKSKVAEIDWHSSEQMRREDIRYKWGVVVDHNPAAVPGAGSCIFLHVWKAPFVTTTGCTAMPERDLVRLLGWLDPTQHPILVQMPRATYRFVQAKHGLPPDRF